MLFMESDAIRVGRGRGRISPRNKCAADSDLGCESNDGTGDVRGYEGRNGCMDVTGV